MTEDRIIPVKIDEEMRSSYIDYSMSVIVSRALPDARDGFKPVQRRVLFGMNELGNTSDKPTKKAARIVGEVMGKYHPHGDSSIYGTLVRLAQPWNMRYCLVDGQGNFGSIDGDGAALMHMGSMAVLGANAPKNMVHVVINNGAHETVGGMPTVAANIDIVAIAKACGYPYAVSVSNFTDLDRELNAAKSRNTLSLVEIKCSIGARDDLGRPTTTALENKQNFMDYLNKLS